MGLVELLLHALEQLLGLDSAFIQLLPQPALLDCFVSNVVQLCNEKVVHLGCTVARHDAHDVGDLPLEADDLFGELLPDLLVFDLSD